MAEPTLPALTRVTLVLSRRSARALARVMERGELSEREAFGRAIELYDYLDRIVHGDGAVYVRDGADGEAERVRVL